MDKVIQEALEQYDFKNPKLEFIRHNENITYRLSSEANTYVIRIHKPVEGFSLGIYQRDSNALEYLESEMQLVDYAGKCMNSPMQKPVKNKFGTFVSVLSDETPVTVLEWVQGNTVENITVTEELGEVIGTMVAKLHKCFNKLEINPYNEFFSRPLNHKIKRYIYDQKLLCIVEEELSIADRKGQIEKEQVATMKDALGVIKERMDELDVMQGMTGIVHADLSQSNLILSDKQIVPIDFSLSGYGFYYMDIGMILSQYKDNKIRKSIKRGYEKIMQKEVPLRYIEPFFALGVLLFVACQHDKIYMQDWFDSATERWCKTIFTPLVNNKNFVL